MESTHSKQTNWIVFAIGFFLFSYVSYRACVLSFTWDEAFSYLQFVRHEVLFPLKYEAMDANNHILNTLLNIYFVKWFGVNEFVLRIPALIAHLLFLFYSYQLIKNFQKRWLVIASFLIVNLNPYVLDFFSLSRGYALSLGLMVASIYYLYAFINKGYTTKYVVPATIFGGLAAGSNLVLLNYFVVSAGLILLLLLYNYFQEKKLQKFLFSALSVALIFSLSLFFFVPIALKLKEAGALFYGGNKGFWTDTFCTITDRSFYELGYNYWFQRFAKGFVILTMLFTAVFLLVKFLKKKAGTTILFLGILFLLLSLSALSTIVQHYAFDTLYLIDRTALFLVVLFNFVLVFFINELSKEKSQIALISYAAALFALFHFSLSFNLKYVLEWKSNADVKEMLSDLEKIKTIPKEKQSINICIPLSFDQSINYYRAVNHLSWVNTVERSNKVNFLYDYLYLEPDQLTKETLDSLEVIKRYPITNNILAKPKYPQKLNKVCVLQELDFSKSPYLIDEKTEYAQGFNYKINDSITPSNQAEVVFLAKVKAPNVSACNMHIVISFENKNGLYLWKRAFIKDWIQNTNEWTDVSYTCIVPEEAMAGDELKVYIWNPNKHSLLVQKMVFKWLSK